MDTFYVNDFEYRIDTDDFLAVFCRDAGCDDANATTTLVARDLGPGQVQSVAEVGHQARVQSQLSDIHCKASKLIFVVLV